ncbi:MAG: tyrosine--tRNA ligase [Actinomycetia bacterium]|nr:tyrosine--tRNA ligase [Actinomycetes bacterium]
MKEPQEQLRVIESGVADIVPRAALLDKLKEDRPLRIKLGVDPTAPDLHLGHAVPLRKLRQFQDLGHTVVLIIGDGTALIGDPSGRNSTRPPLTQEEIEVNAQTYMDQAFRILDPEKTELRYNGQWLKELGFAELLTLASNFTLARIVERDDFEKRLKEDQPISLHELLYPMAQAYDSIMIDADVEIGGTDQLFNLLAGRELAKKMDKPQQVCLTLPLLEGTDGIAKMSKSYGNYIGLTDEAAEMFGKVMSIPDELMVKYYRLTTALPVDEIDTIEAGLADGSLHPNEIKRRLGREIVTLYYDEQAATDAEAAFDKQFKAQEIPDEVEEFEADLTPNAEGLIYLGSLMTEAGLATSAGEARRLIDGGGVKIDGITLNQKEYHVEPPQINGSVIQIGKRKFVRIIEAR